MTADVFRMALCQTASQITGGAHNMKWPVTKVTFCVSGAHVLAVGEIMSLKNMTKQRRVSCKEERHPKTKDTFQT